MVLAVSGVSRSALTQRLVEVTFALSQNRTFAGSGGKDTVTLSGYRASAKIANSGAPSGSSLHLEVYGMTLSLMNQLSTLGMVVRLVPRDTVVVAAGDARKGMTTVFVGTIINAWADFQSAPNVPFYVEAQSGLGESVTVIPVSSYRGGTDVAQIMGTLARQMTGPDGKVGATLVNNGVTAQVANPYYDGSIMDQVKKVAAESGIGFDYSNGVLYIWPSGGTKGGAVPVVSPETGMVGYPSFVSQGIQVRTRFNPSIVFMGTIKVESSLDPANKVWGVFSLDHDLESMVPNGQWFTTIGGFDQKFDPPVKAPTQ